MTATSTKLIEKQCQKHLVSQGITSKEKLMRRLQEIVKKAFLMEPGDTLFYVINAFTAAAKADGLATANVYKLEKAGGQILSMVKS
jgi:hypothetical protein